MCGIAGIVRFDDKPIETAGLSAMLDHLRHRGPDGSGISEHDRCALVHTRLSIIDLLSGMQPMHLPQTDSCGPLHLVFNGEIYNHRYLRHLLEQRGHRFVSDHSDTEVLLFGYHEWGSELPKHVHGMFAFAIWDENDRRLFLVRDRMGKKPLYYRLDRSELVFASLIATIVRSDRSAGRLASSTIDQASLQTYLRLGYPFGRSMINGIEELPPAHWLMIDALGRTHLESYWQPPPRSLSTTSIGVADALNEVLHEAIISRLESDVPLGCFLSGGIDSSVIAAIAQKQLADGGSRLKTFSVSMPAAQYDESEHARVVAEHIGSEHVTLQTEPANAIDDLKQLMSITGEPTADSSILPTYWLCKATRQHVSVVLSGDGGDELFGGYDRYRALRLLNRYGWWLSKLPVRFLMDMNAKSIRRRLQRLIEAARCGTQPAVRYHHMIHLFTKPQLSELGLSCGDSCSGELVPPLDDWPADVDVVHAAMRWDQTHYLPFELLRKIDRASMAVALEVRCPLLDTQVCDLAGHLPTQVLMPGNRPKGLIRQVATRYLPASIVSRPKQGFAVPIGQWFRTTLKDQLAEHLAGGDLETLGIQSKAVTNLLDQHMTGRSDHTHRLFALLQLCIWIRWLKEDNR